MFNIFTNEGSKFLFSLILDVFLLLLDDFSNYFLEIGFLIGGLEIEQMVDSHVLELASEVVPPVFDNLGSLFLVNYTPAHYIVYYIRVLLLCGGLLDLLYLQVKQSIFHPDSFDLVEG